ncbi:MAG: BACON domain-containing protein, partial [Bacteroidales bacterium]|nr:BACON domain-containing protein [Bacteroidales bacterium]
VSTNIDYEVDATDSWVSLVSKSATACTFEVATNPNTVSRTTMVMFTGDGVDPIFVTIVQEPSEEEEDPFDVGSNLSVNGTSNCYIVTKAGNFTFDASVMGNGPDGVIWNGDLLKYYHLWPHDPEGIYFANGSSKPKSAVVIWDDNGTNGTVKSVKYNSSTKTISFTATGKKGNVLIGLYDNNYVTTTNAPDELALWSWHIWCTDAPRRLTQYDLTEQEYIILDRNIGATSADPADGSATWGLFYQFGRKDPLRAYAGMARDQKQAPIELVDAVNHPTWFFMLNTKTCEWFNNGSSTLATVCADLWGNPYMTLCSTSNPHPFAALRSELKKTIYDPCPPGYMVPPETTWNGISKEDIILTEDGVFMPTASGASFYPFAGYISDINTTEAPWINELGWFGFKGMNYTNTHNDQVVAGSHTSCTGKQPSDDYPASLASSWFGARPMCCWINKGDPFTWDEMHFDALYNAIRQRGYPVRCVKQFNQ